MRWGSGAGLPAIHRQYCLKNPDCRHCGNGAYLRYVPELCVSTSYGLQLTRVVVSVNNCIAHHTNICFSMVGVVLVTRGRPRLLIPRRTSSVSAVPRDGELGDQALGLELPHLAMSQFLLKLLYNLHIPVAARFHMFGILVGSRMDPSGTPWTPPSSEGPRPGRALKGTPAMLAPIPPELPPHLLLWG